MKIKQLKYEEFSESRKEALREIALRQKPKTEMKPMEKKEINDASIKTITFIESLTAIATEKQKIAGLAYRLIRKQNKK